MTIKHLVIAGGGPLGLRYLGALEKLNIEGFWDLNEIESIYGTSVGTIIGVFIALKYDWETLNKYIIERPWHDAFKLSAKQIIDAYYNKGLCDKKLAEILFSPLLKAKDLSLEITLKEFYEFSNIELNLLTFELNKFQTVQLSYKTHPDLSLLQAVTMSCSLPGLFQPIFIEEGCYIDGGIKDNYPINHCLKNCTNKDEILGVTEELDETISKIDMITPESSILDFIIGFSINAMKYISSKTEKDTITNEVKCRHDGNFMTLNVLKDSISNSDMRRKWLTMGEEDASIFLEKKNISLSS